MVVIAILIFVGACAVAVRGLVALGERPSTRSGAERDLIPVRDRPGDDRTSSAPPADEPTQDEPTQEPPTARDEDPPAQTQEPSPVTDAAHVSPSAPTRPRIEEGWVPAVAGPEHERLPPRARPRASAHHPGRTSDRQRRPVPHIPAVVGRRRPPGSLRREFDSPTTRPTPRNVMVTVISPPHAGAVDFRRNLVPRRVRYVGLDDNVSVGLGDNVHLHDAYRYRLHRPRLAFAQLSKALKSPPAQRAFTGFIADIDSLTANRRFRTALDRATGMPSRAVFRSSTGPTMLRFRAKVRSSHVVISRPHVVVVGDRNSVVNTYRWRSTDATPSIARLIASSPAMAQDFVRMVTLPGRAAMKRAFEREAARTIEHDRPARLLDDLTFSPQVGPAMIRIVGLGVHVRRGSVVLGRNLRTTITSRARPVRPRGVEIPDELKDYLDVMRRSREPGQQPRAQGPDNAPRRPPGPGHIPPPGGGGLGRGR